MKATLKIFKDTVSGSHKDAETNYLIEKLGLKGRRAGIVSTGNAAISLLKCNEQGKNHIFIPNNIPEAKLNHIKKLVAKAPYSSIHLLGDNYVECFNLAKEVMYNQNIPNLSPGVNDRSKGGEIVGQLIRKKCLPVSKPEFIFVPSGNLDLATGIAKHFIKENITVVACVLPDHPILTYHKSPRKKLILKKSKYNESTFSSIRTFENSDVPALNMNHTFYDNLIVDYYPTPDDISLTKFPDVDPVCAYAKAISETYKSNSKVVLFTGEKR